MIYDHSSECYKESNQEPQNEIDEIKIESYKFLDLKNILINYLNKHPLLTCNQFKKVAIEYFTKIKFKFELHNNSIQNPR